ncbi:MAG: hypothetical protein M1354_02050 [Candidatus Marsarchaeota archaeon]|jgi:hypothetical protein|nr:hypothetical protein [Candidatus Marsarchaeota archaeon]
MGISIMLGSLYAFGISAAQYAGSAAERGYILTGQVSIAAGIAFLVFLPLSIVLLTLSLLTKNDEHGRDRKRTLRRITFVLLSLTVLSFLMVVFA